MSDKSWKTVSLSLGNPKLRARQEKIEGSLNSKVSFDTVCRVLRKTNNLYGRIARTNIINQNLIGIEGWNIQQGLTWDAGRWRKVFVSDECKIKIHFNGSECVRRPVEGRNARYNTKTENVIVWGSIKSVGRRKFVKVDGYLFCRTAKMEK